jgi:dihydrodipicolinate reductase
MKTKVSLSGASGRMGIQIQSLLEQHQEFSLSEILDRGSLLRPFSSQADVWIDFSHDDFLFSLLEKMQNEKKFPALLSGTTNLSEKTNLELRKYAKMAPVLWTPNTSLGVSVVKVFSFCWLH